MHKIITILTFEKQPENFYKIIVDTRTERGRNELTWRASALTLRDSAVLNFNNPAVHTWRNSENNYLYFILP